MPFTFKQFHIDDSDCAMKVSTDGVLLGAWAEITAAQTIMDIGTGSGLLSLMAAQRNAQANLIAVEVDSAAAHAAKANFKQSPFHQRLQLIHAPIQEVSIPHPIDAIICNPPYFEGHLKGDNRQRNRARHTDGLPFSTLAQCAAKLLTPAGKCHLIIPSASLKALMSDFTQCGFHLQQQVDVAMVEGGAIKRHLLCFGLTPSHQVQHSDIVIRTTDGRYSDAFTTLTRAFYLNMVP